MKEIIEKQDAIYKILKKYILATSLSDKDWGELKALESELSALKEAEAQEKEQSISAEEILKDELSETYWEIICKKDNEGHATFKNWIIEAMDRYASLKHPITAKSGRKYRSIPEGVDIESWDAMSPDDRVRYLFLSEAYDGYLRGAHYREGKIKSKK